MGKVDFFALDIGGKNIKLSKVKQTGKNKGKIQNIGEMAFPINLNSRIPTPDKESEMELLSSTINELINSSGVRDRKVVSAIPENVVYTKFMSKPVIDDPAKFEEMIYWEAKSFVPMPIEEVQMDWIKIRERKDQQGNRKIDFMVFAAPRTLVESYLQIFNILDLELIALEVESVAFSRLLQFNYPEIPEVSIGVDIGSKNINVIVLLNGFVVFSQNISTGSDDFTKAISTDYGIQLNQAEQYKINYGILPNQADKGKIFNSVKPVVDIVIQEVAKIINYSNSYLQIGNPQAIFLGGGGAQMKGLTQYFQSMLKINTQVIKPSESLELVGKAKSYDLQGLIMHSVSLGLALKEE